MTCVSISIRKAQLAKEALVPSPAVDLKDFNGLL